MKKARENEYRLYRALSANLTFILLILIFYLFPRFEYNNQPFKKDPGIVIQLNPPPATESPHPPYVPSPPIPVEAESDESVDNDLILPDSVIFELMEMVKYSQGSPEDSLSLLDSLEFEFEQVDLKPRLLSYQEPEYPELARKSFCTGKVILKLLIDRQGNVEKLKILEGNPLLNDAALKAGRSCKFRPGEKDGIPVKVWTYIPIVFRLK
jgi:TonB family protein